MKKIFQIPDMHCSACVMRLEALEDELPGIRSIRASYHRQQLEVDWDEGQLNEEQICAAVQKKGYTISPSPAPASPANHRS